MAQAPEEDARVEDFLNDKFQTLSDLDTLDALLSSVQCQQSLLRSQACIPAGNVTLKIY